MSAQDSAPPSSPPPLPRRRTPLTPDEVTTTLATATAGAALTVVWSWADDPAVSLTWRGVVVRPSSAVAPALVAWPAGLEEFVPAEGGTTEWPLPADFASAIFRRVAVRPPRVLIGTPKAPHAQVTPLYAQVAPPHQVEPPQTHPHQDEDSLGFEVDDFGDREQRLWALVEKLAATAPRGSEDLFDRESSKVPMKDLVQGLRVPKDISLMARVWYPHLWDDGESWMMAMRARLGEFSSQVKSLKVKLDLDLDIALAAELIQRRGCGDMPVNLEAHKTTFALMARIMGCSPTGGVSYRV